MIYTLSLHDALPIFERVVSRRPDRRPGEVPPGLLREPLDERRVRDRKSTRLNSSHRTISYAVFCLKKKKKQMFPLATRRSTDMSRSASDSSAARTSI